jgi:hypothetical protein
MMKRRNTALLALPLMASLCVGNTHTRSNHDGLIAGACAVGAGLLAAAGAVALVDWCCSETDDQLIDRVSRELRSIDSQYTSTMNYFGPRAGVGIHAPHRPVYSISESVLYEFATFVWNQNISQSEYRSGVWSAKHRLQSCASDVRKRINSLAGKCHTYEDQRRLATMRNLLNDAERLLADVALFAECLECHKGYFSLYDSVGTIRNKYIQEITIFESGSYTTASEIKRYIISCDSGQYAFRNFVKIIEGNISTLRSNVYALAYNYDSGRQYANRLIDYLIGIKNIVVSDPRYQQELYEWEQARLERQRIQAMEDQARLERDRIRILQQQNRILEERNRIEREKAWQAMHCVPVSTAQVVIDIY